MQAFNFLEKYPHKSKLIVNMKSGGKKKVVSARLLRESQHDWALLHQLLMRKKFTRSVIKTRKDFWNDAKPIHKITDIESLYEEFYRFKGSDNAELAQLKYRFYELLSTKNRLIEFLIRIFEILAENKLGIRWFYPVEEIILFSNTLPPTRRMKRRLTMTYDSIAPLLGEAKFKRPNNLAKFLQEREAIIKIEKMKKELKPTYTDRMRKAGYSQKEINKIRRVPDRYRYDKYSEHEILDMIQDNFPSKEAYKKRRQRFRRKGL